MKTYYFKINTPLVNNLSTRRDIDFHLDGSFFCLNLQKGGLGGKIDLFLDLTLTLLIHIKSELFNSTNEFF